MSQRQHAPLTLRHRNSYAELHRGDALRLLKSLPSGGIDLLVTSPPYCIGKEYECTESVDDFVRELKRVLSEIVRVVRPGGSLCWQVGYHVRHNVAIPLDALVYGAASEFTDLQLRNRIIWAFGHGAHSRQRFSGRHETIMWFTKGEEYHFDLDAVRVPQLYPGKRHYKGPKKGEFSGNPLGKNPEDVWLIPNVKAKHKEKVEHPCQFPVALASRLIRALAPVGGVVLDPYFGSGTTAVAALLEGRSFLGSEIDPHYVRIAYKRLREMADGQLQVRPDAPVRKPQPNEAVAQKPPHFA
jgi:adenine-specific DNA-methyltransferase